jgi:hypothetical protein
MPDDVAKPVEVPRSRQVPSQPDPATSLLDLRALQILSAEHSSLLATRSLAYNEAFTRAGMFLAFLSMSFVAVALVAQALPINRDFLLVPAIVLAFDLVVGLTTYGRIIGTNHEDYRAVYGMARIRHGYGEIAPVVLPYFTTSVHDDLPGVMVSYGNPPISGPGVVFYQLTTSASMIGIIVSMIGGVLALVVALIIGAPLSMAIGVAVVATLGVFLGLAAMTVRFYTRVQASLQVLYPTPDETVAQVPITLT